MSGVRVGVREISRTYQLSGVVHRVAQRLRRQMDLLVARCIHEVVGVPVVVVGQEHVLVFGVHDELNGRAVLAGVEDHLDLLDPVVILGQKIG